METSIPGRALTLVARRQRSPLLPAVRLEQCPCLPWDSSGPRYHQAPGATAGSARVSRACRVTVTGPRWGKTCPGGLASCGPLLAGLQPPGVQARSPGRVEQASDISAQETRAPGVSSHSCFSSVISWPCRELTAEITHPGTHTFNTHGLRPSLDHRHKSREPRVSCPNP